MFSKKIRYDNKGKTVSVATALVLMAIDELIEDPLNDNKVVYGYQIMTHLRDSYNWNVKSGTVYPILKKLNDDLLIRKGVAQEKTQDSKRQMIFYKITPKGRRLAENIKNLNDDALDTALTSGEEQKEEKKQPHQNPNKFNRENFTEKFLSPILLEFESKVAQCIDPNSDINELEHLREEIIESIQQMDIYKTLLLGHIQRIENYKKIKK